MGFCTKCGSQMSEGQTVCPACGAAQGASGSQPDMPMKWYKFLIYFALFAGAVINGIQGILLVTGKYYDVIAGNGASALVYMFYGSLRFIDIIFGLALIGVAVIAVMTRQKLAGYSADGPKMLMTYYVLSTAVSVVYALLASIVTGQNFFSGSVLLSLVISIVMIFINKVYFEKRAHLFNN